MIDLKIKINGNLTDIIPIIYEQTPERQQYQYFYKNDIIAEVFIEGMNTFIQTEYKFSLIDGKIVIFVE